MIRTTHVPNTREIDLIRDTYTDDAHPGQEVNVRHWTWDGLIQAAESAMIQGDRQNGAKNSSTTNGNGFAGCSPAEAIKRARDGWPEGVGRLSAALDSLAPAVTDGPQQSMDVNGFAVCIGAYIAGDPECMFTIQDMPEAKPVISLIFQTSYSHGVSVQSTVNYAAALTSLVGELDMRGITTALYGMGCHYVGNTPHVSQLDLTPVRNPGAPLDLSKVAFAMSAPMHRRMHFGAWESNYCQGIGNGMMNGGYGLNCSIADDKAEFAREIVMTEYPGAIFMPWIGTLTNMGRRECSAQECLDAMRAAVVASGFQF